MRRGTAVLLAVIAGCTFGSDGGGLDLEDDNDHCGELCGACRFL